MKALPSMRFELMNKLTELDIQNSEYVIYGHECKAGMYIGMSQDPVKRWQEHYSDAFNSSCENYTDRFRTAIRNNKNGFKHYILQVANCERSAKDKEAEAIDFYKSRLNMRPEVNHSRSDFDYMCLTGQIAKVVMLDKVGTQGAWRSRTSSDRLPVTAKLYTERGRKRLVSVGCKNFRGGLKVECSRLERDRFENGDIVTIPVALSKRGQAEYLVAAKTGVLKRVLV